MNIADYGWDDSFEKLFGDHYNTGHIPARVILRNRDYYRLICDKGYITAALSGKIKHLSLQDGSLPVVGDWVAAQVLEGENNGVIHALLPRKSKFSRKPAVSGGRKIRNGIILGGDTIEQVLAANIDTVFIVNGLDGNFNLSRIERYLTVVCSSGAEPVVLLNKADLCENPDDYMLMVAKIAPKVPVHCISAATETGMESLNQYMIPGKTMAFLGSSGVGKSTIINYMFGEERQTTKTTSEYNGKGRHTTTCSELLIHDSSCMLIDTPGLRELKLWCDEKAVEENFEDIIVLISRCKFSDCSHKSEPGCAVKEALSTGELSIDRYKNYRKLCREVKDLEERKKQKELYISRINKRKLTGH